VRRRGAPGARASEKGRYVANASYPPGVLIRSVIRVLRDRARDDGVERGRGSAVVVIQRFGGALNLNVHFHALVPDGVFAGEP